jgi:hypothetical protein
VHSALLHNVLGNIATHVVPVLEIAALVALVVASVRKVGVVRGADRRAETAGALA